MRRQTALSLAVTLLLSVVLVLQSSDSSSKLGVSQVNSFADKWAVVPRVTASPVIDGTINETIWRQAATLGGFRTAYDDALVEDGPTYHLAYDATHLYIGGSFTVEEAVTLARIEIVASPSAVGETYYVAEIPVDPLTRLVSPANWSYDWRPQGEWRRMNITSTSYAMQENTVRGRWELEAAIPLSAFGEGVRIEPGDEWRLNLIHIHNINTEPMTSWIPVRNAQLSETTMTSYDGPVYLSANVVDHGSWGSLFFDEAPQGEAWIPDEWTWVYIGFNEKQLRIQHRELASRRLEVYWKDPVGGSVLLEPPVITRDGDWMMLDIVHPDPLRDGVYQLRLEASAEADPADRKFAVFTMDRHSLIEAGLDVVGRVFPSDDTDTPVTLAPPSAEVQRVLGLIPEQFGVPHIGLPDRPHLRPHLSLYQLTEDGQHIIANETGIAYPNEQYPETHSLTAVNRKGETVGYPYYEDAEGRRYFFSAALWNHQARRARQDGAALAPNDPLGAARILHRFAEASENYVPRTNNEWNTYPLNGASGPPYNFRSGIWSIWKPEELNTMDYMLDMYEQVKKTDAFEVLSQELGEDVELRVRQRLFQPSIDYTLSMPNLMHNTDPYIWQRLIRMSKLFGEPDYIHLAMEWIDQFMRSQFVSDGFWKEITPAYHAQVVNNIVIAIGSLNGYSDPPGYVSPRTGKRFDNLDMSKEYPQLVQSQQMVSILTYPNGKQVPIQDTWASQHRTPQRDAGSMLLPAAGIGRLTVGQGPTQSQLYLMFTPKYGHDQWDPLNLTLFAEGQELLPDIGYTYTKYRQFANSTIGHNTVVVDGRNMAHNGESRHGGNIEQFAVEDDLFQAMRANYPAYTETDEYSRELWYIPFADDKDKGYVVDLFRVAGGQRHEYTLQGDANHDAYFQTSLVLGEAAPYLLPLGTIVREPQGHADFGHAGGHYHGYMHVRDVQKAELAEDRYEVTLVTLNDKREELAKLHMTGLLEPGNNELYLGRSPSVRATRLHGSSQVYDNNDEADRYDMPKLVLRREGSELQSTFVTVMEPYREASIPRIEIGERLVLDQAPAGAVAVQATYGNTTDIMFSNPYKHDEPVIVGDHLMVGEMGMIRMVDGVVREMALVGGTLLQSGDHILTGEGAVSGEVIATRRLMDGVAHNALIVDSTTITTTTATSMTEVTANVENVGKYVIITHPDGSTSGHEIADVIQEQGQAVIVLAQYDPGFIIHEDGSSEQVFNPGKRWTAPHTFRIASIAKQIYMDPPASSARSATVGVITGTVNDSDGLPIQGAEVHVTGYTALVETTGQDGGFTLSDVPGGKQRVTVTVPDHIRTVSQLVRVTAEQATTMELTLQVSTLPELSEVISVAIPGDPLSLISSKDGHAYLVPGETFPDVHAVEAATVETNDDGLRKGTRLQVTAGVTVQLDTTNMVTGRYSIYVIDSHGRISSGYPVAIIPQDSSIIDDTDPHVMYFGEWRELKSQGHAQGSSHYSIIKDDYVDIPFYGTKAVLLGHRNSTGGLADIYVDGEFIETVDFYHAELQNQYEIFNTGELTEGTHVIRMVVRGERNTGSTSNAAVRFDALQVLTGD